MSTYRDDLGAALARAELAETKLREAELAGAERLRLAQAELVALRVQDSSSTDGPRPARPVLIAALVMLGLALGLLAMAIQGGQRRAAIEQQRRAAEEAVFRAREATIAAQAADERARILRSMQGDGESRPHEGTGAPTVEDVTVTPGIDRAAIGAAVARARATLGPCKLPGQFLVEGEVTLVYETSGQVSKALVSSVALRETAAVECVAARFRAQSVPAFPGTPVTVHARFHIP